MHSLLAKQKRVKLNLLKYLYESRNSVHFVTGSTPTDLVFEGILRIRLNIINHQEMKFCLKVF